MPIPAAFWIELAEAQAEKYELDAQKQKKIRIAKKESQKNASK